jgi:uncharacterized protein with PQ loop repeat
MVEPCSQTVKLISNRLHGVIPHKIEPFNSWFCLYVHFATYSLLVETANSSYLGLMEVWWETIGVFLFLLFFFTIIRYRRCLWAFHGWTITFCFTEDDSLWRYTICSSPVKSYSNVAVMLSLFLLCLLLRYRFLLLLNHSSPLLSPCRLGNMAITF